MKRIRLLAVLALTFVALLYLVGYAVTRSSAKSEALRIEVAEDGNRFAFGKERLFSDGMPAYGAPFVTQGFIYPEGTLNGTNGVLANGKPEFPDKVIGEWTCYGYMIGDGAHTTTGVWVVSTQVFKLNAKKAIIVTNGYEIADLKTPMARAITGGTGEYSTVRGEQIQELLGFTEQMGVNLRVSLQLAS